jgi:hypothetical protein
MRCKTLLCSRRSFLQYSSARSCSWDLVIVDLKFMIDASWNLDYPQGQRHSLPDQADRFRLQSVPRRTGLLQPPARRAAEVLLPQSGIHTNHNFINALLRSAEQAFASSSRPTPTASHPLRSQAGRSPLAWPNILTIRFLTLFLLLTNHRCDHDRLQTYHKQFQSSHA